MELQTKQAILKYFKNCIEEDSKEALKINLDNNKSNIYFPLWEDESFDEFLNLSYDKNEKNNFYQTLWVNIDDFDNDFLIWFFVKEKIDFDKTNQSVEKWWKYELNKYISYKDNSLRQKILDKLIIYQKLLNLELPNLDKEDLENLFFSPDNKEKGISKIDFKPNLDFLDFYDNNKNESFYLVLEYIKVLDKDDKWKVKENVVTPLYLIWIEVISNENGSFTLSLKESEPEFLYNIKTQDNKNIFSFYSDNPWDDGFKEMEDLENNIKWITSSFKEKINYYKLKISKEIDQEKEIIFEPCIISWANNISYIKNLISDYNWIVKETQKLEDLKNNSLGFLFGENIFEENELNNSILNITELNKEQANIVKNSLNQNISVVIWPPWTWKSQVVVNLLANIYINNKTVIFASKNNTAVDTVVEKLEKYNFSYFPFLRLWNNQKNQKVKEMYEKTLAKLNQDTWAHKQYSFQDIENQKEKINWIYENIENIEKEYLDYYQEYEKFELLLWEIADEKFKSFLYKILPLNISFEQYKNFWNKINKIIFDINNLNIELDSQEWKFLKLKNEIKSYNIVNNLNYIFPKNLEKLKNEFLKEYDFFIKNISISDELIKELKEKIKSNKISISSKYKTIKNFNFEDNLDFLIENNLEYSKLSIECKYIIYILDKEYLNIEKYDLDKYFVDKDIKNKEIIRILKKWKFINYKNNLILELQKIKNNFIDIEEYWLLKKLFWIKKKDFKRNENLYLEILNKQEDEDIKNYFLNINKTQSNDDKDILVKIQYIYSLKNYEENYKKYSLSIQNLNIFINKQEDFIQNIKQNFWDIFINKEFDSIAYDFEIISFIYNKLQENIGCNWIIEKNNNIIEKLNNNFNNYINLLSQELYLSWIELNYENILKLFDVLIELQTLKNQINDLKLRIKNQNHNKNEIENIVYKDLTKTIQDEKFLNYIKEKNNTILELLEKILSLEELNQTKNNINKLSNKLKENKNNISLLSKELFEEQRVLKQLSIDYLSYQIFENIKNNKPELKDAIDWVYNAYDRSKKTWKNKDIFLKEMYEKLFWKINIFVTTNQSTWNLPLEKWFYDYLIIDEASQNDLASIIPLMYRCKKLIIIWDPNQLQNITKLKEENARQIFEQKLKEINIESKKYEYEFKHIYNYWKNDNYNLSAFNSINHIYNWSFNKETFSLREHYRCHADIINFSNQIITDYNLFPKDYIKNLNINPQITPLWIYWIKDIKADNIDENKQNSKEAKEVIETLKQIFQFYWDKISIWVISPYRNQVNLLNNLWNNYLRQSSLWETKNILIDTVHKFQWDEKDIILYSPVYPKSNLWNDKNLLNVAVSRAKSWFYVFWDKNAIYKAHEQNWINLMKKLIDYVDVISKQKEWFKINKFDTNYEKLFFDELKKAKIKFDFHVLENNWKYELDFKLKLKWFNQYLNIELDWNSHDNKKSYDYTRNVIIEKLWDIKVVRYTNRYLMQNIWEIIESLKKVCELENEIFLENKKVTNNSETEQIENIPKKKFNYKEFVNNKYWKPIIQLEKEKIQIINDAIKLDKNIKFTYKNWKWEITKREIKIIDSWEYDFEWIKYFWVKWFCKLRNEERVFNIKNMRHIEYVL